MVILKLVTVFCFEVLGNQLKSITTPAGTITTYTYDANGNLIEESDGTNVTRYSYNVEGKLIQVEKPDESLIEYGYDGDGRRISQTVNGVTTRFYYDRNQIAKEMDTNGVTEAEYLYGLGGMPVAMMRAGQTYYYLYNGHGDTVALTDSMGAVAATYQYDPFGKATSTGAIKNPFQYGAKFTYYYDSETGNYFIKIRYYNSTIGRFISPDTFPGLLESPISQNAYLYANSDPINYVDPDGHFSIGQLINDYVVQPIKKYVVEPIKKYIIEPIKKYVIDPFIEHVAKPIYNNVIKPIINSAGKAVEAAKKEAERLAEEQRQRWENFKKDVAKKKEEFNQKTQDAIDEAFQVYKAGKEFVQEKAKEGLASLAQAANKFMDSEAGQVVKDLVKIGGGLAQIAVGLSPIGMIFSGKLLEDGVKNLSEGMNSPTGKFIEATGKVVGGLAETAVGVSLAIAGVVTAIPSGGLSLSALIPAGIMATHGLSAAYSGIMDFYYMGTNQNEKVGTINPFRDILKPIVGDEAAEGISNGMDYASILFAGPGLVKVLGNAGKAVNVIDKISEKTANVFNNFVKGIKNTTIYQREVSFPGVGSIRVPYTIEDGINDLSNMVNRIVGKSDDAGDAVRGANNLSFNIEPKITKQMGKRGWSQDIIKDTINNPVRTVKTQDTRWTSTGGKLNDPATAYYYKDGGYVVRNNRTGDIVQVSNRNDSNWIAPWDK